MALVLFDSNILIDALKGYEHALQELDAIMKQAARIRGDSIRKGPKIALPDAIIMATALSFNLKIITRNKRDFKGPNIRIPYELVTSTTVQVVNAIPPEKDQAAQPAKIMRKPSTGKPPR